MSDTLGRELALAYDGQGRVVRLITAVGEWHYGYDGAGNLQEARDPAGGVTRYLYEDARDVHNLTGVLDAAGVRTQSTSYSANDRVVTASLAENTDTISITYLPEYRRVISNALGVMTEYELEVRNQVARVKSYSGGLCASRCQEGLSGSYRHDNQLRLLSATDGKGYQGPETHKTGIDSGISHYHIFEVQQIPSNCKCIWKQRTEKITGNHHYYHQPNIHYAINLNGSGRPPKYPH